jgi:hypothetical protein
LLRSLAVNACSESHVFAEAPIRLYQEGSGVQAMGHSDDVRLEDRPLALTICRHCGAENVGDGGFCGFCGNSILEPPDIANALPAEMPGLSEATKSDATRYMCAAVHSNSWLRERIVHDVVNETFKAPPRSPDIDLVTVVLHALAARRRQAVCDLLLTVLLLVGLYVLLLPANAFVPAEVAAVGMAWLICFISRIGALYGRIAKSLRPHNESLDALPKLRGPLRTRISSLQQALQGNVTIYGGYSPFFGSGGTTKSWSFPLDRLRAADGKVAQQFNAQEIHDFVVHEVRAVGLPRVSVEDRVFVDGRDIVGDSRFIQHSLSPPLLQLPPEMVRSLRIRPEDKVRPYACFYVRGWGGQLVSSTYLRFVVTRRHLFVEATSWLLPPIIEKYQKIDHAASRPRSTEMVRIGAVQILLTPLRLVAAPWLLLYFMARPWQQFWRTWSHQREITRERSFNYGTVFSPRQAVADPKFQRYFQELDSDQYNKIIEKNILQSLVEFLDDHGIDTTELVERQTTILNNGVYVTGGGTVNAENLAAGNKAKATTQPTTKK